MKRLLSVFLILVMMLSLVPLGVYAETTEELYLPPEEIVDSEEGGEAVEPEELAEHNESDELMLLTAPASTGSATFSDGVTLSWSELQDATNGNKYGYTASYISDTEIGGYAFYNGELRSIVIPDSVVSIGSHAFYGCGSLTEVIFGNNITNIGDNAFANCQRLTSADIPDSVTSIGSYAFYNCWALTDVGIPDGVADIYQQTFYFCSGLKSVTVPSSVKKIGVSSFDGCRNITDVFYAGTEDDWASIDIKAGNQYLTETTIHYGVTESATHWKQENVDAKCDEAGYSREYCECGYERNKLSIDALGHQWVDADCTAPKTCSVCGETEGDIGHKPVNGICSSCGAVEVSEINFPDEIFRAYIIRNISGASDAWLTKDELRAVTSIYASNSNISSFKGIEYFTALKIFNCVGSRNLTSLDLSNNTELNTLYCDKIPLTTLDLSKNTKLTYLNCSQSQFTNLDLSKNTMLHTLFCQETALTTLDLSKNTRLVNLSCENSRLTSLNISNCDKLETLYCFGNLLTNLDLSGKDKLISVNCNNNLLTSLNLRGCSFVQEVQCDSNQLTSLSFPGCTELRTIFCAKNQLTELNVKECKNLSTLDCRSNYLEKLDVRSNTKLGDLRCEDNYLTSLDLTKCTALRVLWCSVNELESLDLSKNTELHTLYCGYNYLTSLDLSNCLKLSYLDHQYNIREVTAEQNRFDLSTLPNFDVSRVVEVVGGTLEGNILTAESEAVGYYYDCGLGVALGFVLVIENFCEHDWPEESCTETQICTLCGAVGSVALGHDFGEWEEVDEDNVRRECTRCGYEEIRSANLNIILGAEELGGASEVWIDGVATGVVYEGDKAIVYLPENATVMTAYTFHSGDETDVHTQYPTFMKVWMLKYNGSSYSAEYIEEFDNLLQYSGSSIRISGNKGIRMISSVDKAVKQALTGGGLAGYKLVEYGTLLAQTSKMEGGPLILGQSYSRSNYAYKKGVADPVFKDTGKLVQYTNVLVGFNNDQCKEDIAMRPYMIVEDAEGNQFTIYGGILYRSIGYIAWQNRNAFQPKTAAYNYVWEIIHHVYGNRYDSEFKG